MKGKSIKELRESTKDELIKMKGDNEKKIMGIRYKGRIEKTKNPMEKRILQKTIAVINTILTERELKIR